jgi:hypothetical protein
MRERVQHAIDRVYDATSQFDTLRPGEQRENVFDFEDGVRAIISIDSVKDNPFLHCSYSLSSESKLTMWQFVDHVETIPNQLWPDTVLTLMHCFATQRAFHFIYSIPQAWKNHLTCVV